MNFEQQIIDLNQKVYDLEIQLDNVLRFTAPQRLVCALKRLCQKRGLDARTFILPMTKSSLSLHVGIEQETLSRMIHKLNYYGVNISGKTITFYDSDRTLRTVCDHCAARQTCAAVKYMAQNDRAVHADLKH